MQNLPSFLKAGEPARLIPVSSHSGKEQRAISVMLASLAAVDGLSRGLLGALGAPVGRRASIACYTEIVFAKPAAGERLRPDGLIVVTSGRGQWLALVEAKIGGAALDAAQIDSYLALARANGVDAVITVSNQFAARADHSPVAVNRTRLRAVALYHWSWSFLLTEALLLARRRGAADPDQAYVLGELIRYLRHDNSGVCGFSRMPASWKWLCRDVRRDARLSRSRPDVAECVRGWHELTHYMALSLSQACACPVTLCLTPAHRNDPRKRLADGVAGLVSQSRLQATFAVPGAAARIGYGADLARRTLSVSMTIAPPSRCRAKSTAVWITRYLRDCRNGGVLVVADWPRRHGDTVATLDALRDDPLVLVNGRAGVLPRAFDVRQVVELGPRFAGARTFAAAASQTLTTYYADTARHLRT